MKLSCVQENLHRGVSLLSQVVTKSGNLPILSNLLLQTENNLLYLSATNLEIGVRYQVRGKVEEDGVFTIPARLFSDLVANLPNKKLDLTTTANTLEISTPTNQAKVKGLPADDFPVIPWFSKNNGVVVDLNVFKSVVDQVAYAAATDDTRPELNSVLFDFRPEELVITATDGYRLSENKLTYQQNNGLTGQQIVPLKTAQAIMRLLPENQTGTMEIYTNQNQLMVVAPGLEIVSRLVNGHYPDYEQVIPSGAETEVLAETSELVSLVKTASLFCRPGINDVKMSVDTNNKLRVAATNEQVGESKGETEAKVTGPAATVVFNYRYLLDALQHIGSKTVLLKISGSQAPVVFYPTEGDKELTGHRSLIMPIKQ